MSTYLDVYFGPSEPLQHYDVEDAIEEAISGYGEIVGSGAGMAGSNIDIELADHADADAVTGRVRMALVAAGARMDTLLKRSDWVEGKTIAELMQEPADT